MSGFAYVSVSILNLIVLDVEFHFLLNDIIFNGAHCDDSLIEEVFALMKICFIIFLHITNRIVYMESTRLYIQDKEEGESELIEKRIESINNTK